MYVFRVYADRIFTEAYGLVMCDTIPQFIDIIQFAKHISVVKLMSLIQSAMSMWVERFGVGAIAHKQMFTPLTFT